MARFTRVDVFLTMKSTGLVPLFYHENVNTGIEIIEACYKGGARIVEFTNRGDYAHEVFAELNRHAHSHLPDLILGVGSVTDGSAASLYMQLGANFVVTPVLREDIALVCNRKKVLWSPGCATLGEISRAEELGCELVKLFPGGVYGPGFVKTVKGPCPWTEIMPTGGVSPTEENLRGWFEAGVACVGMGSKLISKDFIQNRNYKGLEELTRSTLNTIKEIRS